MIPVTSWRSHRGTSRELTQHRRPPPPCRSHPSRSPIYSPHLLASTDSSDGKYLATSLSTQAVKVYQRTEDGGIAALVELTGHGAAVTDVTIPPPRALHGVLVLARRDRPSLGLQGSGRSA